MHDNGFTGIADTDPLCLGIVDDIDSHLQVRTLIHINMAITGTGLDDRDRTVFPRQRGSAVRFRVESAHPHTASAA